MDLESGFYQNHVKVSFFSFSELELFCHKVSDFKRIQVFFCFHTIGFGFGIAERVLENYIDIGISEFGRGVWRFEYITIVCVQEYFC